MTVKVVLKGPETRVLEVPEGTWHILADRAPTPEELPDPRAAFAEWVRSGSLFEELTAVFVPRDPAGGLTCRAFRSLFSGFELYRAETPEGDLLLTDDFRIAGRAAGRKTLPVTSLADFLLFQHPAGRDTFLPGVYRLGPGEALTVHPAEPGRLLLEQAETVRLPAAVSPAEALERSGEALSAAVAKALEGVPDAAVLLSGGIDSTLVALFAGNRAAALHAEIDCPELACEEDYAEASARELGRPLARVVFSEEDFLDDLTDAVRAIGRPFPVTNYQVLFHNRLFRLPWGLFLSGDLSDRLFGHPIEAQGTWMESPLSALVLYCPPGLLCGMFGRDLVESRVRLYEEALERVIGSGSEALPGSRKIDLAIFFGLSYWVHYFRPLAAAYGKRFIAPFGRRGVFEAALSCPARHELGAPHPKPLLREMLRQRLPGYPADGKKGGSGVPRTRFCLEGPMKDFFRRRELPSNMDSRFLPVLREPAWETSALVLQAACYRLWEDTL